MVSEDVKVRTIQGYANISSSKGSIIMFDILNFFSQLCLEIYFYGERKYIFFSLYKHLRMVRECKKSREKQPKIFPPFFVVQNQTGFFNEGI